MSGELGVQFVEEECKEPLKNYENLKATPEAQKEIVMVGVSIGGTMLTLGASDSAETFMDGIESLSKLDDEEFDKRWDEAMQMINPSDGPCPELIKQYRAKKAADRKEVAMAGLSIGGTVLTLGASDTVKATADILGGLSSLAA